MTSAGRPEEIPSNERLVDELTRDLESGAVIEPPDGCESNAENQEPRDEDWIDDDILKKRDDKLSNEEKREHLETALSMKNEGNIKFKNQEHEEASKIYTDALQTCPLIFSTHRAILFANRAAAKSNIHIESAIQDCTRAIELDPYYVKALIRRSKLFERNDKLDEALEDLKKVLEIDRNYTEAAHNARILQEKINERNEKLKTEMMAKLKDLGNMVLKPFGLSTQNFQVDQDPNTGGYSINFKQ